MSETGGTKFDSGKADLSLLPLVFLEEVARAMMEGEAKYGRWNYAKGMDVARNIAAAQRHLGALNEGEWFVPDSIHQKFSHAAAVAANMLMIIHCLALGTIKDERRRVPGFPGLEVKK